MTAFVKSRDDGRFRLVGSVRVALSFILLLGLSCARSGEGSRPATIVMLPDTQIYAKAHPELFHAQTQWVKANRDRENIVFVTQVGDIVNDRATIPAQWTVASDAMATLDGVVPWGVAIGNHDFDGASDKTKASTFLRYFGPDRFQGRPWYGGASANGLNSYQIFSGAGVDFVILHLEIDIPDSAIAWATDVLRRHPTRAAIVSTHIYLKGRDGIARGTAPGYNKGGNSGEVVWDKLIRGNPQIFLVLCGHEGRTDEYHQVSTNDAGHKVLEMLADYQKRNKGGDGFLRLIRLDPAGPEIQVRTYSPSLDRFETDPNSQFTVPWELPEACRRRGRTALAHAG